MRDLEAAGVSPQGIDRHAVTMYVALLEQTKTAVAANDAKLLARLNRDAIAWANQIGATPAARARMNIQPPKPIDPDDPWDRLG